ncbi:hypothetical protein GDO86_019780 [Hymenochirus boettgeri]|uniref:NADH dehydrogenase [ubiquinone] 1 beta subcomplex subunit 7 n=1 Tax=Hymenochirus boettgeri TaxID=247094 RepID=A0A8T2IJM9_9PIPI|nr:hypothetical protein GDO86_019780 [Hymenochirus boettgeri]
MSLIQILPIITSYKLTNFISAIHQINEFFHPLVMVASQEEMNLAQLPLQQRDYCAHHLIKLMKCKRDMWPNFLACKHERHDWDLCQHEDYVQRMKQYERERRLLVRQRNAEQAEAA